MCDEHESNIQSTYRIPTKRSGLSLTEEEGVGHVVEAGLWIHMHLCTRRKFGNRAAAAALAQGQW